MEWISYFMGYLYITLEKKQFDNLHFNKNISSKFQRFYWIPFLQKDSTMFPFKLGEKKLTICILTKTYYLNFNKLKQNI